MKRPSVILLAGAITAIAAFVLIYFAGTAGSREMLRQPNPELAWLKKEFKLKDEEFRRISELHESYLPKCAERCMLIEEQSAILRGLLATNAAVTPAVEQAMLRRAAIRAQCETEMMRHFVEVSRTMPPEQGRRYLRWVEQQTILRGEAMELQHHQADEGNQHQLHQH